MFRWMSVPHVFEIAKNKPALSAILAVTPGVPGKHADEIINSK